MSNIVNLALKAKVMEDVDEYDSDEGISMSHPDDVKIAHGEYMAFYAKKFWKNPAKAKMEMQRRSNPNGRRENVTKMRIVSTVVTAITLWRVVHIRKEMIMGANSC